MPNPTMVVGPIPLEIKIVQAIIFVFFGTMPFDIVAK
jgi:hypothetical protein